MRYKLVDKQINIYCARPVHYRLAAAVTAGERHDLRVE